MSASTGAFANGPSRLLRVANAIEAGDIGRACRLLEGEVRKAPANTRLRLKLAHLKEAASDREGAAAEYTRVLRLSPGDADAASAFGQLLAQGRLAAGASLDPVGFAASMTHKTVDRDLLGAAALDFIAREGTLAPVLGYARSQGFEAAVRAVLSRRSAPMLRDPLLISVLENCTVNNAEVGRLLTAIRRVLLLEVPRERLAEPDLARFTTALAVQCWDNEYVFAAGHAELVALDTLTMAGADLTANAGGHRELLLRALYHNPLSIFSEAVTVEHLASMQPQAFAQFLVMLVQEREEMCALSKSVIRLGSIEQATSLAVKAQYETHPYPRWRGTALYPNGRFAEYLENFFSKRELAFLASPFEVLIAGCGTGLQAVSGALDYGKKAHVTGLDISSTSLAYAALMARRFDAGNLSLALGDIEKIDTFVPTWSGRFRVIECSGVLHHMADPFGAWHRLLDCLAPGGIMLVGLYSRLARRDLETLRQQPEYPGPGATDEALSRYRDYLISRGPDAPGAAYLRARDTFTTSGFRDFFLHVSEKTTTLAEIQSFLEKNDLVFRGFVNAPFGALTKRFPDERWPGSLERWAELENEQPDLFIGMYQFWLTRR